MSGLLEQLAAGLRTTSADGLDLVGQLRAIRARVDAVVDREYQVFTKEVVARARGRAASASSLVDDLSPDDRRYVDKLFAEHIFPVLTPLAVDPAHPFPYISNLSLSLAVTVRDPATGEDALRAGQGAAAAAPLPCAPRRPALRAARAAHRGAARHAVSRHGGAVALPRSGSRATPTSRSRTKPRTSSRRSSRCCGAAAASASSCGSRSTPRMTARGARPALPGARALGVRRHHRRRPARPRRALRRSTRSTGPTSRPRCGCRRRRTSLQRRPGTRLLPPAVQPATCSCTTPTTRSPPRSSSSSSRRPAIRTCSRSSRPSTAPPGPRARSCAR